MKTVAHKFETQVHLGLSVIILVLLALNAVSNAVLYSVKRTERDLLLGRLQSAAMAASRIIQEQGPTATNESVHAALKSKYDLEDVAILPALPVSRTPVALGQWLVSSFPRLPMSDRPGMIEALLAADARKLYRVNGDHYFVATSVPGKPASRLVVVTASSPELAQVESAGDFIFWSSLGAIVIIALAYVFLWRRVVRPYQRWREAATAAGRTLPGHAEPDMMAEDYRAVIEDLRRSETELRRLHEQAQQRADSLEQFNAHLLASMSAGLMTFEPQGTIRTVNHSAADLLSIVPDKAIGSHVARVTSIETQLADHLQAVIDGRHAPGYTELTTRSRSDSRTLGVLVSAIRDPDDRVIGYSLLLNDLTELTRLRAELEQARRLSVVGEMAAGLAHQIRNALGAINGFATLVRRRLTANAQATEHLEALLRESRQSEALLSRFLDFARPLQLHPEAVDIGALLDTVAASARSRHAGSPVALTSNCRIDQAVTVDPLLLTQALGNLVDNAYNAIGEHPGNIELCARGQGEELILEVSDTGPGIEPEQQARIFAPFVSTRPSGSGLGLPLVARIAELHRGTVSLYSSPGEGATFQMRLPAPMPVTTDGLPVSGAAAHV